MKLKTYLNLKNNRVQTKAIQNIKRGIQKGIIVSDQQTSW